MTEEGEECSPIYDIYVGHVVIAETAYEARLLCPYANEHLYIWTQARFSKIKKIGETKIKTSQVVLSAFNAG